MEDNKKELKKETKKQENIHDKLLKVQLKLKAPKNQRNDYGGFNYRSCEDILEAVKPILKEESLILRLTDEIVSVGDRFYVKAIAILTYNNEKVENVAYAREEETKKGMDGSQITGSASSYARKYALNGLFLIDDVSDSDNDTTREEKQKEKLLLMKQLSDLIEEKGADRDKVCAYYNVSSDTEMTVDQLDNAIRALRKSGGR